MCSAALTAAQMSCSAWHLTVRPLCAHFALPKLAQLQPIFAVLGMQGHPEFQADEVMQKIFPDVASLPGVAGREQRDILAELQGTSGTELLINFVGGFLSGSL